MRPFIQTETRDSAAGAASGRSESMANRSEGMGNVRGASANWRPLNMGGAGGGRVDLLATQRTQLQHFSGEGEAGRTANVESARLNDSFGSNHSSETYGSRETYGTARSSNAMEINKIAQCSKMVPGMSGSEIRSTLTAVNWDTVNNSSSKLIFHLNMFCHHTSFF